jgi:hypothetical protein
MMLKHPDSIGRDDCTRLPKVTTREPRGVTTALVVNINFPTTAVVPVFSGERKKVSSDRNDFAATAVARKEKINILFAAHTTFLEANGAH